MLSWQVYNESLYLFIGLLALFVLPVRLILFCWISGSVFTSVLRYWLVRAYENLKIEKRTFIELTGECFLRPACCYQDPYWYPAKVAHSFHLVPKSDLSHNISQNQTCNIALVSSSIHPVDPGNPALFISNNSTSQPQLHTHQKSSLEPLRYSDRSWSVQVGYLHIRSPVRLITMIAHHPASDLTTRTGTSCCRKIVPGRRSILIARHSD